MLQPYGPVTSLTNLNHSLKSGKHRGNGTTPDFLARRRCAPTAVRSVDRETAGPSWYAQRARALRRTAGIEFTGRSPACYAILPGRTCQKDSALPDLFNCLSPLSVSNRYPVLISKEKRSNTRGQTRRDAFKQENFLQKINNQDYPPSQKDLN